MKMLKFTFVVIFIISLSAFLPIKGEAKLVDEHIYLEPTEGVDRKIIEEIRKRLPLSLPMVVRVGIEEERTILQSAYDPARKQYDAKAVLGDITRQVVVITVNERALAIVNADLYVPGTDFVLGASDEKSGTCMMSLARLNNEFYGLKADNKIFLDRVIKVAMRELGESWGLGKCSNPKCVMVSFADIKELDKKKAAFCHDCLNILHRRYGRPLTSLSLK